MTLPGHGRYEYSSITRRPDYSWPGGHRLAVYVALNIEAFGFGVGKGAAIAPPDQAQSHSIYSWRDYGNRVGIWRLFDLLDDLKIPAEAQMNTEVYTVAPDIPERLRARGYLFGHSRLAVSASRCVYCGLCQYGCPYRLVYNAASTLERLQASAMVDAG